MSDLTFLSEIRSLVSDLCERAGFNEAFEVRWNTRLRTTAGRAWTKTGPALERGQAVKVEFAHALWGRMSAEERRQTVIHEVSHLIANVRHNDRCGHDWRWQEVMRGFGVTPDRCHNFNVDGLQNKRSPRVTKRCPGDCGWAMTRTERGWTRLRNDLRKKRAVAHCPRCKWALINWA